MTVNLNSQRIASILRQIGAVAALAYAIVGSIQSSQWGSKNTVLTLVGGLLLTIEHFVGDPSTGTTLEPVTPPVAPPPSAG